MVYYTDQTGNRVGLAAKPERIVSLVPSQSEFLWDLGLQQELVGITKFCIHPGDMFRRVSRVGGTKALDIEKIRKLKPDLIIGNKEENEKEQIEILQKEFPVWMSDICTFDDAYAMMKSLGELLGKEKEADSLLARLRESLSGIRDTFNGQKAAYFIWNKPYMLAAKNTFIDTVLNHLGFQNAMSHLQRYPETDGSGLREINPAICFLSSEPFPFREQHALELQKVLPASRIMIVDGEVFSWYGTRLLHLEKYVKDVLAPAIGG